MKDSEKLIRIGVPHEQARVIASIAGGAVTEEVIEAVAVANAAAAEALTQAEAASTAAGSATQAASDAQAAVGVVRDSGIYVLVDVAGAANAITANLPAGIAEGEGLRISLRSPLTNTGPVTLSIGGGVERAIRDGDGYPLKANALKERRVINAIRLGQQWWLTAGEVVAADLDTAESNMDRSQASAIRDAGVLQTAIEVGSTGDAIALALGATMVAAGVFGVSTSSRIEYVPAASNAADNPTITIAGTTYAVRNQDGGTWPAGGFRVGRSYTLRRYNNALRVVSGEVSRSEVETAIATATADTLRNDAPADTDAGLRVIGRDHARLIDVSDGGLRLAGRAEAVETTLDRLSVQTVTTSLAHADLDLAAMQALSPEGAAALMQGLAARGGRCAPVPAWQMPQPAAIGQQWLASETITINANDQRISADPFYIENIGVESFVHPYVAYFPHGFLGYQYLLAVNPYPGSTVALENPVLYGSNDMQVWDLFEHIHQPLAWPEEFANISGYCNDPALSYDPLTGELILLWRRHLTTGTDADGHNHIHEYRTTLDGVTWSPRRKLFGRYDDPALGVDDRDHSVSPSLVYNPAARLWYLYSSREQIWLVRTKRNIRNAAEPWSAPIDTGARGWHGEVRILGGEPWLFSSFGRFSSVFNVWRSVGGSWTGFQKIKDDLLDTAPFNAVHGGGQTYKNSFIPRLYADGTADLVALIQCRPSAGNWWLYRKQTTRKSIIDL